MGTAASVLLSGVFGPAWLAKLIGIAAALFAIGAAYLVWHHHVYQQGWKDHEAAIARQDAKAVEATRKALDAVRLCKSRGLRWNQSTGNCDGG